MVSISKHPPLISQGKEPVVSPLTVDKLDSPTVSEFGALLVNEVMSPLAVGGHSVLAGDHQFFLNQCTPTHVPNAVPKTCIGSGIIRTAGTSGVSGISPLLRTGDVGLCTGTCSLKGAPWQSLVTCKVTIVDAGQERGTRTPTPSTLNSTEESADHPDVVCLLPMQNQIVVLTVDEYQDVCRSAEPLEALARKLAETRRHQQTSHQDLADAIQDGPDAVEAAKLKLKCADEAACKAVNNLKEGLRLGDGDLTEVLGHKGRKRTYTHSKQNGLLKRTYPIEVDIREKRALRNSRGEFDRKKIQKAVSKVKIKVKGPKYESELVNWIPQWAEDLNRAFVTFEMDGARRHKPDARYGSGHHVAVARLLSQAYKVVLPDLTDPWELQVSAEGFVKFSAFEADAFFTWYPLTRDGVRARFHAPLFKHPLDFGIFAIDITGNVSIGAIASLALALKTGVSKKEKTAGIFITADAFGGVKAEISASCVLKWKAPHEAEFGELGVVNSALMGAAGAGAGVTFKFGFDPTRKGKFTVRVKGQLVWGVGGGGELGFEVDIVHLWALILFAHHSVKEADFSPVEILKDHFGFIEIELESEFRKTLEALEGWVIGTKTTLEEAGSDLGHALDFWTRPWNLFEPATLIEQIPIKVDELKSSLPNVKARLLELLCEEERFTNEAGRSRAISTILAYTDREGELEQVMIALSPKAQPRTAENGRRYLLAHGGTGADSLRAWIARKPSSEISTPAENVS